MEGKTIVINLFGGPGSGKSTGAAYIFSRLKMAGVNCELITEYAKDCTWEKRTMALDCQEYILGKQSYRMWRCADKVDVIITDSPLPTGLFYNHDPALDESFSKVVMNLFNKYDNHNYCLIRTKEYNPIGRNQTKEEADEIGDKIQFFLDDNEIKYTLGEGNIKFYNFIVTEILLALKEKGVWKNGETVCSG